MKGFETMKFTDFEYVRPNVEELKATMMSLIEKLTDEYSFEEQYEAYKQIDEVTEEFETMGTIASIRNSINTKDEFYDSEMKYYDEKGPVLSNYMNSFSKLIYNSKFKDQLVLEFGKQLFDQIELSLKTFDEKIIPLLIEENKISREYSNLIAAADRKSVV